MQRLRLLKVLVLLVLVLALAGCTNTDNPEIKEEEVSELNDYKAVTLNYEIYGKNHEVTFTEPPERAVTLSQFMTEMLLALDLGEKMVGTAFLDNEIYAEFKEAYERIPVLSDKYPSKEVLYSVEPDFVSGWTSAFDEKRVASAAEMMESGIKPYLATAIQGSGSLDAVYQDFRNLGKIFAVEEKAEEVITKMQAEVKAVHDKIGAISEQEMVKVLAYDSGDNEPFVVAGGGISGDIIRQAQGKNIFEDIKKGYATVSWEEVVQREPDLIVIVDYGDTDFETKLNFLKQHPALQDLQAVTEERFIKIGLADLSPGIRNTRAVQELAQGFYPEKFE